MSKIEELILLVIAFSLGWYLHTPSAEYITTITFCIFGWLLGDFLKYVVRKNQQNKV
jgi:hypothetical protein